ncbi:hypothetical protein [Thalassotalea castellviae]|uniref:DUF4365 domain-containing protein n=1 Tax=Thalassotalea castellviae TaxID=3075612 RepID=A0ABU3A5C3_9GAMM|nr:hypothetical protein [Thalassotalea sp. W431]MDT0605379.1 hypothetical protein [Thalassotalea sp. W431]
MDTSQLEHEAEDYISSYLNRRHLLIAKPKFDVIGTDLLAFAEMSDGVKFCRIQCKGRSLLNSDNSNVHIPVDYVTDGFIVFLYIDAPLVEPQLYMFFPNEVRQWNLNNKNNYALTFSKNNFESKLSPYKVTDLKIKAFKLFIEKANVSGEFKNLVLSEINFSIPAPVFSIKATVTGGE